MLKILKAALKVAAKDDPRRQLFGIHCMNGNIEATDGRIALRVKECVPFTSDIIIDYYSLEQVLKMATSKSVVKLSQDEVRNTFIHIDDFKHPLSLIYENRFPDLSRVIPHELAINSPTESKGFNNKLAAKAFTVMSTLGVETSLFNICTITSASMLSSGNITVLLMGARL